MRTTVSALALLASIAPAAAADVYSSAKDPIVMGVSGPANWTGLYFGVEGGYGQDASSRDSTLNGDASALLGFLGAPAGTTATGFAPVKGADPTGFLFGGQVGYLYQPIGSSFVFGAEFDFDGSNITGDKASTSTAAYSVTIPGGPVIPPGTFQQNFITHQELDYVGTLTGVAGVTMGNVLLYGKAGLAFGQVQESISAPGLGFPGPFIPGVPGGGLMYSRTGTDTGWTVGAGVGYKWSPNWAIKFEGDYFDLGSHSLSFADNSPAGIIAGFGGPAGAPPITYHTTSVSEDFWTAKAAVVYQVGGAYASLK